MRKLISNAFIVSVDPKIGDLPEGDILVEGGKILDIRPHIDAADAELIDASGCIAIPGFVDTHRHLWEGSLRAATSNWSIHDFSGNMRMFAAQFLRPEDMYVTAYQGALESLNAGVTTIGEYCHNVRAPEYATEGLRGVRDSAIRAVWAFGITGLANDAGGFSTVKERLAYLRQFAAEYFSSSDQLITLGMAPEETYFWRDDPDRAKLQFDQARDLGARIFMHANSYRNYDGRMPRQVELMHKYGLLGPDLVLVHMCFTEKDEWRMLGDAGAHISYTPETEYQMGLGWPSVTDPAEAGVNFGIGVDITANNSADMFFQLRCILQFERARIIKENDRTFFSGLPFDCKDALYWGTMCGAKALGLENKIGSLAPGKEADIVLIRGNSISMAGWDRRNPASAIIQQAGTQDVDTVLVGGNIVKRDGKLAVDVTKACQDLEKTSAHVHAAALANGGLDISEAELRKRVGA